MISKRFWFVASALVVFCSTFPKCKSTLTVEEESSCETPAGEKGRCVRIANCHFAKAIVRRNRPVELEVLLKSFCGTNANNTKLICCGSRLFPDMGKRYNVENEIVPPGASCRTPNNEVAFCVPLASCPSVLAAIRDSPDSAHLFYRQSRCSNKEHVCCGTESVFVEGRFVTVREGRAQLTPRKRCGLQQCDDSGSCPGDTINLHQFPWMAIINYRRLNETGDKVEDAMCSGSLINDRYVLTTADCANINKDGYYFNIIVTLGEHHRKNVTDCMDDECADEPMVKTVQEVIIHPNYTGFPSYSNNIALLKIESIRPFTNYVRPVCLPREPESVQLGDIIVTSGFGVTDDGNFIENDWDNIKERYSVLKKYSNNTLTDKSKCVESLPLKPYWFNLKNEFCTENDMNCYGDAGGPAMVKNPVNNQYTQIGIFQNNTGCGRGNLGIYEKVEPHVNWIKKLFAQKID